MTGADSTTLMLNRVIDAPRARVFDAWLVREEWQAWLGPEGVVCDVPMHEPWVGGRYRVLMNMPGGDVIKVAGVFQAIEKPARLVFTWGAEGDPARQTLVTLTFNDLGAKTELILKQEGLGTPQNRDAFAQGWKSALDKLVRHLAQKGDRS